jgi:hypothetical protein
MLMSTQPDLVETGTDFSITNTYFLGRLNNGALAVFWHYTQGNNVITMYVATARQPRVGVFQRDNKLDGPARFPRSYASEYEALKGMLKPAQRDKLYTTGQSALAERFIRQRAA